VESIYYVLTWLCHRQCAHCYEDRFRPYHGAELVRVVEESRARFRAIIDHFPERMTYRDPAHDLEERRGRVILAGGEILLDPVRETVLYPALERLRQKYDSRGGVQLIVQTTGDVLTDTILRQLLDRQVNVVSVSGIDGFHAGLEHESARDALCEKLTRLFESAGMTPQPADTSSTERARARGSVACGREAAPTPTHCPPPPSPTTSATGGRAGSTSSSTASTARRCRSTPRAASTPAA